MGSKTTTKTNEVQSNAPPEWAQPGLSAIGNRITDILPQMPGPKYAGDFVAQPSDTALQLPQMYRDAGNFAQGMVAPTTAAMNQTFNMPTYSGPSLAQGTQGFSSYDPTAIAPVIAALNHPVVQNLMEQVLPSLKSSAAESGAYSGSRAMTTLPELAMRDAMSQMTDNATKLGYQDFTDQQNRNLQAFGLGTQRGEVDANTLSQRLQMFPDLADTVMRMQTSGVDMNNQAAQIEQAQRQNAIDNQLQTFDYGVRYPFQGLDVAASLLGQIGDPWGTRTTNGTTTQSTGGMAPIMGGLLGAGMTAASLYSGFGGGGAGGLGGISSLFARKPTTGFAPSALGG